MPVYTNTCGFVYEKRSDKQSLVHILKIDPKYYQVKLVKAQGKSREPVSVMAKRYSASFAINGGCFEIGGAQDGLPSKTLVIEGEVYRRIAGLQALLVEREGTITIEHADPEIRTLIKESLLTGIPMLINRGEIFADLSLRQGVFYTMQHARTAIGVGRDKSIILVVVEHYYSRDINEVTIGELKSLMREKGHQLIQKYSKSDPYDVTLRELREILAEEFSPKDKAKGMTILELARLMKDLGCEYALNLDGGGSSTLWIDGKVVNTPIGDGDEGSGVFCERAVSDAILFVKRIQVEA